MPALDFYHEHVKAALIHDGWTITKEHFRLPWKKTAARVDLGAERLIAADKAAQKIAVEIKSFLGVSELADLYNALGQIMLYRNLLQSYDPERTLYLALREEAYLNVFGHPDGDNLRVNEGLKLLVFNPDTREVIQWIE